LRLSADRYEEALVRGEIKPNCIPVPFGIFSDKRAQLDGEPTARIEHFSRREVDPADVARALEGLRAASVLVESTDSIEGQSAEPSDSSSADIPPK
jgi:hypothetical protein